jgi:hypothetical protein
LIKALTSLETEIVALREALLENGSVNQSVLAQKKDAVQRDKILDRYSTKIRQAHEIR